MPITNYVSIATMWLTLCSCDVHCAEAESGRLRGRVLFSGPTHQQRLVDHPKARDFGQMRDESFLVDEASRGISNVVVYLIPSQDGQPLPQPSESASRERRKTLTAKDGRFLPRILTLRTGEAFILRNTDTIPYGFRSQTKNHEGFNVILGPGEESTREFPSPVRMPTPVFDGIHLWIRSYVVVLEHSCVAVTDSQGSFVVHELPIGVHRFRFWHAKLGFLKAVQVDVKAQLKKGILSASIQPGMNDSEASSLNHETPTSHVPTQA